MERKINAQNTNIIVGKKVKQLRKKKGWSQEILSIKLELLGIHVCRGSISKIENQNRVVTDEELYGLAKVFNVPIDELFKED